MAGSEHSCCGRGDRLQVVAADGAYDTRGFYGAAVAADLTQVLVPPKTGAAPWDVTGPMATPGAAIRNDHWAAIGPGPAGGAATRRAGWKQDVGYHVRSLVESVMFRLTSRIRSRRRSRSALGQLAEMATAVALLNRDAALGHPVRYQRRWATTWPTAHAMAA